MRQWPARTGKSGGTLAFLDAAGVCENHALNGGDDPQASGPVERGQIGFGSIRKDDVFKKGPCSW